MATGEDRNPNECPMCGALSASEEVCDMCGALMRASAPIEAVADRPRESQSPPPPAAETSPATPRPIEGLSSYAPVSGPPIQHYNVHEGINVSAANFPDAAQKPSFLIVGLVLAAMVGGGAYYFYTSRSQTPAVAVETTETVAPEPDPVFTEITIPTPKPQARTATTKTKPSPSPQAKSGNLLSWLSTNMPTSETKAAAKPNATSSPSEENHAPATATPKPAQGSSSISINEDAFGKR